MVLKVPTSVVNAITLATRMKIIIVGKGALNAAAVNSTTKGDASWTKERGFALSINMHAISIPNVSAINEDVEEAAVVVVILGATHGATVTEIDATIVRQTRATPTMPSPHAGHTETQDHDRDPDPEQGDRVVTTVAHALPPRVLWYPPNT